MLGIDSKKVHKSKYVECKENLPIWQLQEMLELQEKDKY